MQTSATSLSPGYDGVTTLLTTLTAALTPSASDTARLEPVDTLPVNRCGCVPSLGVLYEEEDPGLAEAEYGGSRGGGWAKKIPLLGPFWCVRNTHSTTIRRR